MLALLRVVKFDPSKVDLHLALLHAGVVITVCTAKGSTHFNSIS